MAKRGYAIDPNREPGSPPSWYDVAPSPRRYINRWAYLQDYEVVPVEVPPGADLGPYLGSGFSGIFSSESSTTPSLEGSSGILLTDPFSNAINVDGIRLIEHVFATIKVVDNDTPVVSDPEIDITVLGELAIDSDEQPVSRSFTVDPSSLEVYDGWLISDPVPRPVNLDGGPFSKWGQGDVYDGAEFNVIQYSEDGSVKKRQDIQFEGDQVYDNDDILNSEGEVGVNAFEVIELISSASLVREDKILGRLSYEMIENVAVITEWSHYNWHDDRPIRRAFKALLGNIPYAVDNLLVTLPAENSDFDRSSSGRSFWQSLGFEPNPANPSILKYKFLRGQSY